MTIEISKEELQAVFDGKGKKGFIFLNDPIFDDLWKSIGMDPPHRNKSELGWKYAWWAKEPVGRYKDTATEYEQMTGEHKYKCLECDYPVDYFIGGPNTWWQMLKPAYCPHCGTKLEIPVSGKEVIRSATNNKNSEV